MNSSPPEDRNSGRQAEGRGSTSPAGGRSTHGGHGEGRSGDPTPVFGVPTSDVDELERMNQRIARIKSNRFDMAVMLTKNREEHEMTGREHFLGFRLVPNVSGERDPAEELYWGTILPLRVARKHPELLGLLTVHYQTVYCEERLPDETRFIVRPGKCRTQSGRFHWRIGLAAGCALAIATYLGIAFSQKLWPF